jgi:hypothetical protein
VQIDSLIGVFFCIKLLAKYSVILSVIASFQEFKKCMKLRIGQWEKMLKILLISSDLQFYNRWFKPSLADHLFKGWYGPSITTDILIGLGYFKMRFCIII